ncbi:MAG: amidohydrolase [Ruminococcaceae bacterium]|nr:amidohydrolase [Oscillospiraceae bacterium]
MNYINARIVTCDKDFSIIELGYITVKDGRIAAVGDMSDFTADSGDTVDLEGRSVYPGFIDAHSHLGMWENGLGFEGDDGNESTEPSTPHLRALDAVNAYDYCFEEALAAGITTVMTGPGSANPIAGQALCIKTIPGRIDKKVIREPGAMKFALGENPKNTYHEQDESPVTRMATAAIIREQLMLAKRYMEEKNAAESDSDLPDYDMKLEALVPVLTRELPAHFHCHRRDDIFTAIRIAEEFNLDYVLVHATEGYMCADELAECGARVLAGPIICDRAKPELRNLSTAAPGKLEAAGILPAIITDHPVVPIHYLTLSAGIAAREGLSRQSALLGITRIPAELLGIAHRVGSIEVGKDADFSVFSGDPLSVDAKPEMVVADGVRRI